jgi:hypothetical protein
MAHQGRHVRPRTTTSPGTGDQQRPARPLRTLAVILLFVTSLSAASTFSAFTGTGNNPGNSVTAGSVALTDNDSGTAMFTMTNAKPGDTDSACIQVTSTGTLPSLVKLYGSATGTGLGAYLNLTVTRGTVSSGNFDDCTNFTADATNYAGLGAGVLSNGLLNAYPTTYAGGLTDPRTASVAETWTTGEVHAYKFTLTVQDVNAAQGLNVTQAFTWEARNTTAYSQVILSDQPSSYWKLDEAAGTSAADSAGSVTGTYTNGPVVNQVTGVKDAGTAVQFDGTNDYVTLGNNYGFAATAAFSAELWVNPNAAGATSRQLINKTDASAPYGGWCVYLQSSGQSIPNQVSFQRLSSAGVGTYASSTAALPTGTWSHVVVTYDGANMRIYVNGALQQTTASAGSLPSHTSPLRFANEGTQYFSGKLDEIAIFSSALNATQVTDHYNAGKR